MPVDVITSTQGLEEIAAEWDALWQRSPEATPFQSPHWLMPWWKHFGSDDPYAIAVRSNGSLDAFAPLYILRDEESDESLGMFLGSGITDYLDAIVAPGADAARLVEAMTAADCQMWDLQQMRPSSPLLNAPLPDSWSDHAEDQEACPVLCIENAGADLQNILSTHSRKKLRYFRRLADREGTVRYESATRESLDELLAALYELHGARWQRRGLPGVLADKHIRGFHRAVARRMFDANALRMYAMRINDRIVAVFYGFAHHGTVFYYLSGYDPDLENLSLGNVIVAHAIDEAVAAGAHTFDFLRGAEEYKYAWGAKDRMNRRRQLFRNG